MTDHYILYSYWLQCDSCRVMQAVAICSPVMPFWYFGIPNILYPQQTLDLFSFQEKHRIF